MSLRTSYHSCLLKRDGPCFHLVCVEAWLEYVPTNLKITVMEEVIPTSLFEYSAVALVLLHNILKSYILMFLTWITKEVCNLEWHLISFFVEFVRVFFWRNHFFMISSCSRIHEDLEKWV